MTSLIIAPSAAHDMDEIWWFVARESATSADRLIGEIAEAFELLLGMPEAGHRHPGVMRTDLRCWSVRSTWLIFYRHNEEMLEIVRVVSGRRDLRRL